jgi:hypothetical protein
MEHAYAKKNLRKTHYAALVKVRNGLKSGRIPEDHFNMGVIVSSGDREIQGHCGTVGCIGGWMGIYLSRQYSVALKDYCALKNGYDLEDFVVDQSRTYGYRDLFFPHVLDDLDISWSAVTPGMAVDAIDNFLNTGKPDWEKVVRVHLPEGKC